MTALFEIEATVNGGPLDGRPLVVKVHRQGARRADILTARVLIEGRMVPVDIAAEVLRHTQEATA